MCNVVTNHPFYYWIFLKILSMVEEAAGTKLYESKKSSAEKTIEKKDSKLNEIEKVITLNHFYIPFVNTG